MNVCAADCELGRRAVVASTRARPGLGHLLAVRLAPFGERDERLADRPPERRERVLDARRDLRHWYWCNVFTERYSSAVETKSRRDYAEMTSYWLKDGPEPSSLSGARQTIGAPTFHIRSSASYASAVYSGVFCLLAMRGARDWQVDEHIELQRLQDHHIFPQTCVLCIYRLTLHPLSKYPGPKLAGITSWYSTFSVARGDLHEQTHKWHTRYGTILRAPGSASQLYIR